MVAVVVPALIAWSTGAEVGPAPAALAGLTLVAAGLAFVVWTVTLFARVGRGTLAPWDPTSRLVVVGPYCHVRNPMITGVATILAGEALGLWSLPLLLWLAGFAAVNAVYLPLFEEPGLARRFGRDYDVYRANVRRWLPRIHPWRPDRRDPREREVPP